MRYIYTLFILSLLLFSETPIGLLSSSSPQNGYSTIGVSHSNIRAIYLNRYAASPKNSAFKRALRIAQTTPVNAFVIDIKDVGGYLTYKSSIDEVVQSGASRRATIPNLKSYISMLKSKGVYTIARIAVFKDKREALRYPNRAVKSPSGRVWRDRDGGRWIDPYSEEGRRYTIDIAKEVAKAGFDEINFDYIRFPARKGLRYAKADTQANRVNAIKTFLSEARDALKPLGVNISIDIFGYVLWNRDDLHIGQTLESMAPYVDYVCPMLYPSGYYRGTIGLRNPAAYPYLIVKRSLQKTKGRVSASKFRPWLQSFRDYAFDKRDYRHHAIAEQIRAIRDFGASGWMLWNPSSRYRYVDKRLFSILENKHYSREIKHKRIKKYPKHKEIEVYDYVEDDNNQNPLDILK